MQGNGGDKDVVGPDRLNNVEQVSLSYLPPGKIAIQVTPNTTHASCLHKSFGSACTLLPFPHASMVKTAVTCFCCCQLRLWPPRRVFYSQVDGYRVFAAQGPQPYALVVLGKFTGVLASPSNPVNGAATLSGDCQIVAAEITAGPSSLTNSS